MSKMFAVCLYLPCVFSTGTRQMQPLPRAYILSCVFWCTLGKIDFYSVPDIKHMANYRAHGKSSVSVVSGFPNLLCVLLTYMISTGNKGHMKEKFWMDIKLCFSKIINTKYCSWLASLSYKTPFLPSNIATWRIWVLQCLITAGERHISAGHRTA